jgi:polysaccharide biosynthesis protein PslG
MGYSSALLCLLLLAVGGATWRASNAYTAPNCSASAAKGRVGGQNGSGMLNLSDADLTRVLAKAQSAGMSAIRLDIDWSGIEPSRGNLDWRNTDRVISAIVAHGMCPLGVLTYTPMWATNPDDQPTDSHYRPKDPNTFGAFVRAAANRYRGSVTTWEIWNEPNWVAFFKPKPDVNSYGPLLTAAYNAIKSVDSSMVVISGGLAPAPDDQAIAPLTFVSRLYSGGFNHYFDGVGVHPYTYPALPNDPATSSWSAAQQMWPIRDAMVAAGDADKWIWITECGAPTGTSPVSVSEAVQAETLRIVLQAAKDIPWLGPAFVYGIRDDGPDLADPEQNFGIVRRDFSPKAAYDVVRQFGVVG